MDKSGAQTLALTAAAVKAGDEKAARPQHLKVDAGPPHGFRRCITVVVAGQKQRRTLQASALK
jgi:hypothetical protein